MHYNVLFRWFFNLTVDDAVAIAPKRDLLSDEHFSVDGTLIRVSTSIDGNQKNTMRARDFVETLIAKGCNENPFAISSGNNIGI